MLIALLMNGEAAQHPHSGAVESQHSEVQPDDPKKKTVLGGMDFSVYNDLLLSA